MLVERPEWSGRTVVCVASGPSLTQDDCTAALESGHPTIVTNSSFRMAPWADVLFAFDSRWWRAHIDEVKRVGFRGRLLSFSQLAQNNGAQTLHALPWFRHFGNSGACAISLAVAGQAARVVLLGFDCGFANDGRRHWHGDHPKGLSNCASIKHWPGQFKRVGQFARDNEVQVINASRSTALTCFARAPLCEALRELEAVQ